MAKKIKSFTVDEEAYSDLVKMFKDYDVNVSVSSFVDGCMKELISTLKKLETAHKSYKSNGKKAEIPFSNIINSIVFSKTLKQKDYEISEDEDPDISSALRSWDDEYKANKRGLSMNLYSLLDYPKLFELSADKKYLIDKKSGKKELLGKTKDGLLELAVRIGDKRK